MKYRQGFVSNSSSTSFCIYGIEFQVDYKAPPFDLAKLEGSEVVFLLDDDWGYLAAH